MAYRLGSALMDPVLTVLYVTAHQSAWGTLSECFYNHTKNSSDIFRAFNNVQRVVEISAADRGPFNLTIRNGHAPNLVSASRQTVRCGDSKLAYNNGLTWASRRLSPTARQFVKTKKPEIIKAPHYWPSVRGIRQWPVNSPHKGPVIRKCFHIGWHHVNLCCLLVSPMTGPH